MEFKAVFFALIFRIVSTFGAEVGDQCVPNNSVAGGVCTLVTDCEEALKAIRNRSFHQFQRCGFNGDQEVVCCPQTENKFGNEETQAQKIANDACTKISRSSLEPLDLHIIGGELASLGEFPHMVAIGFDRDSVGYEFDCGGTIVSKNYVLTAAHCIDTLDRIEPSIVRAGVVEIGSKEWNGDTDHRIAQITVHPSYKRREKYHDLALLRLERPLEFSSTVNAACLYTGDDDPVIPLTITGWGQTSTSTEKRSNMLLKANVTVVSRDKCGESYSQWRKLPRGVTSEQLCAGDPEGLHDTCQGDSGGPLQGMTSRGPYRVVGITSFGRGCGSPVPGVYTRVSHYLPWIVGLIYPQ